MTTTIRPTAAFGHPRTLSPGVPSNGRTYFPALDGLRALAFLVVFGNHYLMLPWGWAGVDIFFVLSGFLITGSLFDTIDDPCRVRNFYIRRILRIFPLAYGVMLLLILVWPIFHWQWSWSWLLWPAYLGNYVRGHHVLAPGSPYQVLADAQPLSRSFPRIQLYFGHFWSLCVEEQFYLFWPWVVFWLRDRKKLLILCLASVVACPLLRILATHTLSPLILNQEVLYRYTPFRMDALLLGGLIALVQRGPSPRNLLVGARATFAALLGIALAWLILDPAAHHGRLGYVYPEWRFTWGLVFIDLLAACLIVMAIERGSVTFRLFNLRPMRWLGRISYGAYVFHDVLHGQIARLLQHFSWTRDSRVAVPGAAFTLTLLLSWASFRWFESPFIQLKDRLAGRSRRELSSPQTPRRKEPPGWSEPRRTAPTAGRA